MFAKRSLPLIFVITCVGISSGNDIAQFICTDGTKIDLNKVCNGAEDCPDGSDETKKLCYHIICPQGMFRCHYGACIQGLKECDGKPECADLSDESQCGRDVGSCEKGEFRCRSGQCIQLEQICDGSVHCTDGSDESQTICEKFSCPADTFHCKYGGCIHLDACCNGHNDCIDGSDESELLCKNMKCTGPKCSKLKKEVKCPALDLSRMEATCESDSTIVPCDNPVPLGTKVKYNCKEFFKPVNNKHTFNTNALCQLDGRWNKEILKCEPECGRVNSEALPLVVHGWDTNSNRYPWYAAMYHLEEDKWEFWCGGTLLSEKTVLTAGHCTWNLSPETIKIGVGKYHSEFTIRTTYTQIKDVQTIISQPLYQDRVGNYGSDLSLLILKEPVQLSATVLPGCVDWDLEEMKYHLRENSTGLIVGMGITENDTFSETLRGVYIPVVSNDKCLKDEERDFRKYVTYTVFCAGWRNGTGVCNGDSGGGMMFPRVGDESRWVIQGVVSISPRRRGTSFCDPNYYTVFTKLGLYISWLKRALQRVHHAL